MEHNSEIKTTIYYAPAPCLLSFFVLCVSTVSAYPTEEIPPPAKYLPNRRGLARCERSASAMSMLFLEHPSRRGGRRYSLTHTM